MDGEAGAGASGRGRSILGTAKLVFLLLCAGLLVIFTLQNTQTVEIDFLWWTMTMSRAVLVFVILVTGFAMGWLFRSLRGG